jgi:hypothetical protein
MLRKGVIERDLAIVEPFKDLVYDKGRLYLPLSRQERRRRDLVGSRARRAGNERDQQKETCNKELAVSHVGEARGNRGIRVRQY